MPSHGVRKCAGNPAVVPKFRQCDAGFPDGWGIVPALAEAAAGFVWRFKDDNGGPSSYVPFSEDPLLVVNMSVWESIEALHAFTYRSDHGAVYAARKSWFQELGAPPLAMWWIRAGEVPTLEEGRRRWQLLCLNGPTPEAFTFKQRFVPGAVSGGMGGVSIGAGGVAGDRPGVEVGR